MSVITRQHAAVAERAIRIIKKRLDDKLSKSDVEYPDGEKTRTTCKQQPT